MEMTDTLATKLGNAAARAVKMGYAPYVERVHIRAVLGIQTDNPLGLVFVDLYNVVARRTRDDVLQRQNLLRVA